MSAHDVLRYNIILVLSMTAALSNLVTLPFSNVIANHQADYNPKHTLGYTEDPRRVLRSRSDVVSAIEVAKKIYKIEVKVFSSREPGLTHRYDRAWEGSIKVSVRQSRIHDHSLDLYSP